MDASRTDPFNIRGKDTTDEYIVESILGYSGSLISKFTVKFVVKWLGYEEETLEPWGNLQANEVMHQYLRDNNLAQHIPKAFRA